MSTKNKVDIRFAYAARRVGRDGFAPVVEQTGPDGSYHEHGGWVAQGYDEDLALALARESAGELARAYVGDWVIHVAPKQH